MILFDGPSHLYVNKKQLRHCFRTGGTSIKHAMFIWQKQATSHWFSLCSMSRSQTSKTNPWYFHTAGGHPPAAWPGESLHLLSCIRGQFVGWSLVWIWNSWGEDVSVAVVERSTTFFICLLDSKQPKYHLKPFERTNRLSCHEINGAIGSGHVLDFASLCAWTFPQCLTFTPTRRSILPPKPFGIHLRGIFWGTSALAQESWANAKPKRWLNNLLISQYLPVYSGQIASYIFDILHVHLCQSSSLMLQSCG